MSRRKGELPELPFRHLGDPLYSQRNPHQLFLLVLSVVAALGLVQGATGSAILDDALTDHAVTIWGICLLTGSLTALGGMWWPRTWSGLLVERAGLAVVAVAAALYSILVYIAAPDVAYTAFVHVAYAGSCMWRCKQITSRLRWVRAQVDRLNNGNP